MANSTIEERIPVGSDEQHPMLEGMAERARQLGQQVISASKIEPDLVDRVRLEGSSEGLVIQRSSLSDSKVENVQNMIRRIRQRETSRNTSSNH